MRVRLSIAVSVVALVMSASPAFAADAAQGDADIVVTATKREVVLSRSAGSITAVSDRALAERNVSALNEAVETAPNVTYELTTLQGPAINIRGVSNQGNGVGFEVGVSAYIDEIYLARASAFTSILADVERVEVLRGPQGTLFGKNTVGGLIHIITKKPTQDFELSGDATYGSRDLLQLRGTVNAPLSDTVALRVTGIYKDQDGWERNRTPGAKALYGENFAGGRAHLLFTPNSDFEMLLSADYSEVKGTGDQHLDTDGNPHDRVTTVGPFGSFDRKTYGVSNHITGKLGGLDLISISAFRHTDTLAVFDQDFSAAPGVLTKFPELDDTITQEVRLQSDGTGRLNFVLGGFYLHSDTKNAIQVLFGNDVGPASGVVDTRIVTDSIAGFASADFKITDALTLTGGVRYTQEKKKFTFATKSFAAPLPVGTLSSAGGVSEGAWSGDAGLNYQATKSLFLYAKYARGFKSGGFDNVSAFQSGALTTIATGGFIPFDITKFIFRPETVDNFEVGAKIASVDGRYHLYATGFYMNYKDKQEQITTLATLGGITVPLATTANAAKVDIHGVEVEGSAAPVDWFRFDASVGYLSAKYKSFVDPAGKVDRTGLTLTRSPRWTATAAGNLFFPGPFSTKGTARLEVDYRSRSFLSADNNSFAVQSAHALLNGRIGIERDDQHWGLFVWGKNITNSHVFLAADQGLNGGIPIPPPSYGAEARFKF